MVLVHGNRVSRRSTRVGGPGVGAVSTVSKNLLTWAEGLEFCGPVWPVLAHLKKSRVLQMEYPPARSGSKLRPLCRYRQSLLLLNFKICKAFHRVRRPSNVCQKKSKQVKTCLSLEVRSIYRICRWTFSLKQKETYQTSLYGTMSVQSFWGRE